MTDDDVNAWEKEVFSDGQVDAVSELAWSKKEIETTKQNMDEWKCCFAAMKFNRDDKRMELAKNEVSRLRDYKGYLEHRIAYLKEKVAK